MQKDVAAFTVEQPKEALDVLTSRAEELQAKNLTVVPVNSQITQLESTGLRLGSFRFAVWLSNLASHSSQDLPVFIRNRTLV